MNFETMQDAWHRAIVGANWIGSTSGGTVFNSLTPSATEPGTAYGGTTGIWSNDNKNSIMLIPVGAADNSTFSVRVEGLRRISDGTVSAWVYTPLAQFACTTGTQVGVAGGFPTANDRFADTITKTYGGNGVEVISPTGDGIGYAVVDLLGSPKFRISHANTNGTASNSLFALL